MKHLVSTRRMQLLPAVSLALVILPVIEAEPRCPGNVASVTPQFVQHALIVIPVRMNQAGPFDFMVDTGSQVTVIDPSLAAELDLRPQGKVGLVSVANVAQASATILGGDWGQTKRTPTKNTVEQRHDLLQPKESDVVGAFDRR